MCKEFWCPENTDKVLSGHNFSPDHLNIAKGLMVHLSRKTIKFKQKIEFQSFKIIQDLKLTGFYLGSVSYQPAGRRLLGLLPAGWQQT